MKWNGREVTLGDVFWRKLQKPRWHLFFYYGTNLLKEISKFQSKKPAKRTKIRKY